MISPTVPLEKQSSWLWARAPRLLDRLSPITWLLLALLVRLVLLPFALPCETGGGPGIVLGDFVARMGTFQGQPPVQSRMLPLANAVTYNVLTVLSPLIGRL